MDTQNLEDLKENLYRKGFGTSLNSELEQQVQSGQPEFALEHFAKTGDDEMGYRLHFRRDADPGKDKVYLNTIDAALLKNADAPGEVREQSFPADWLITAAEAHRMLKHGDLVAVNKTLFNKNHEQYNTWMSIDVKGQKDEYGNFPVNSYHQNYYKKEPFVIKDELKKLLVPVKEVEVAKYLETIEKSLKKANLVNVTIMHNGEESSGVLAVNPKAGRIDVYDKNMQLIENQQQTQQQKEAPIQKNETPAQNQEDVKKKSWPDQKVNWEKKNTAKGITR